MSREFQIPYYRVSELTAAVAKLNRKGAKLGCEPIKVTDLGVVIREWDEQGRQRKMAFHRMLVEGVAPKIEGWDFLGVVEATELGNKVRSVPGREVPEQYRTTKPECDHCRMARRRKETFIVQKEGELKQVGRQCLRDFLWHKSPEKIAEMVSWVISLEDLEALQEAGDDGWGGGGGGGGGGGRWVEDVKEVVAVALRLVKNFGFTSKAMADEYNQTHIESAPKTSTADDVKNMFTPPGQSDWLRKFQEENQYQAEDKADADKVVAWIEAKQGNGNYEYNLKLLVKLGYVEWKEIGLITSAAGIWAKEQGLACEKAKVGNSQHVGTVGERLELELEILEKRYIDGQYGRTVLHKFADEAGNLITWFASGGKELGGLGDKVKVKATIKKHDEYKGVKQTMLSRAAKV